MGLTQHSIAMESLLAMHCMRIAGTGLIEKRLNHAIHCNTSVGSFGHVIHWINSTIQGALHFERDECENNSDHLRDRMQQQIFEALLDEKAAEAAWYVCRDSLLLGPLGMMSRDVKSWPSHWCKNWHVSFFESILDVCDQIWSVILPPSRPPSSLAVGRNCAVQGSGFATWLFASRHGPWTRLARASRMDHGDSGCYCHISLLVLLLWLGCFASPLRTGWSISGSVSSRRAPVLRSWESHDLPVQRGQYRDDSLRRISWSCGLGMIGWSSWDLLRFGACVEVMFAGCLGCALEFRCFIGCSTRTLMIFNYPMCNLLKTLEKRACSGQD